MKSDLVFSPPRYTFNEDEGELPDWFVQEEKQHRIRQLPVDKKEVEHYRKRWREINARPIKKVAEAKARKKRRVSLGLPEMLGGLGGAGIGEEAGLTVRSPDRCSRSWSRLRRRQKLWLTRWTSQNGRKWHSFEGEGPGVTHKGTQNQGAAGSL